MATTIAAPTMNTAPDTDAVVVAATSTPVLAANTAATYRGFFNVSDEVIWLGLSNYAVANRGIPVPPQVSSIPGVYEMSLSAGNLFTGHIQAICASGSKTLVYVEAEGK